MLIICPECKKEVSSEAKFCPHCAYPLKGKGVQTVEQTGKGLKGQLVGAAIVTLFGLILLIGAGAAENPHSTRAFALLLSFGGVVWHITVKILIWWRHA